MDIGVSIVLQATVCRAEYAAQFRPTDVFLYTGLLHGMHSSQITLIWPMLIKIHLAPVCKSNHLWYRLGRHGAGQHVALFLDYCSDVEREGVEREVGSAELR
jgi:hypothetical protein